MPVVRTVIGLKPPVRADGNPWTTVSIEEAGTVEGPYNEVESLGLDPLDADPSDPQTRDLTFNALLAEGWYRFVWVDEAMNESPPTTPINITSDGVVFISGWRPTVDMVAVHLRARTKDAMMNEVGTFNENTRPTAEQVEAAINTAIAGLLGCVGDWLPGWLHDKAQRTIALGAALIIELAFWPEQIEDEQSPYEHLRDMYAEEQKELCQIAGTFRPDDIPGPGEVATGVPPRFYFGDGNWTLYGGYVLTYDPANEEYIWRLPPEGPVVGVYTP